MADGLRTLSLGITGDWQTAGECENDTYLEAWNSIPPHEPTGYFHASLARITRHLFLNRGSRLKRNARVEALSAELEQCILSPDDAECRLERLVWRHRITGVLFVFMDVPGCFALPAVISISGRNTECCRFFRYGRQTISV